MTDGSHLDISEETIRNVHERMEPSQYSDHFFEIEAL